MYKVPSSVLESVLKTLENTELYLKKEVYYDKNVTNKDTYNTLNLQKRINKDKNILKQYLS